jgi:hypothetical protein
MVSRAWAIRELPPALIIPTISILLNHLRKFIVSISLNFGSAFGLAELG